MQAKYDKAIAVGMAGVLLLFISIYLASYATGINRDVGVVESYNDNLVWAFTFIISTFSALFIIGFVSVFVATPDISSYRDAMKVSVLAGAVPMSLVILVIAYLILHIGSSVLLPYSFIGLAIFIFGIAFSAMGGVIGYTISRAITNHK